MTSNCDFYDSICKSSMSRKERQAQTIERKKRTERIEKVREKRWSKRELVKGMNDFLSEAKMILGIF